MVDYRDMSSDRMAACRVFSGEILRIRTMIAEGDQDAEFLNQVINWCNAAFAANRSRHADHLQPLWLQTGGQLHAF